MEELATAVAVVAIATDPGLEEEQQPNSTADIVEAAEVLRAIDANAGGWGMTDAPSNLHSTARGSSCLHIFRPLQTLFGLGRDRR